jgi:hypothetical protein
MITSEVYSLPPKLNLPKLYFSIIALTPQQEAG